MCHDGHAKACRHYLHLCQTGLIVGNRQISTEGYHCRLGCTNTEESHLLVLFLQYIASLRYRLRVIHTSQ